MASPKERTTFVARYKLTKVIDLKGKAMHPHIAKPKPGKCLMWGMDLIRIKVYFQAYLHSAVAAEEQIRDTNGPWMASGFSFRARWCSRFAPESSTEFGLGRGG